MKMKVLLTALMVVLLSVGFNNTASAQYGRHGGRHHRSGFYYGGPRVVVAVRPPVNYYGYYNAPRYRNYGYRRYRGGYYNNNCYNGYNRGRNYNSYDRNYNNNNRYNNYRDNNYRSNGYNNNGRY